jgi:glycosyltransferase involved in cell wall biosynthesis
MNVLVVIDDLGSGGAQRQLVGVAAGLAGRGHRVGCFTYYSDPYFSADLTAVGVTRHEYQKRGRFSVGPVLALRDAITQGNYETVIEFQETPSVYAEVAGGLRNGVRVIAVESSIVYGGRMTTGRILKSHLHRLSDVVVCNSHTHHNWLAQSFPFLRGRLRTVWNGVDLEVFRPSDTRPERSCVQLLGVGRITPAKNIPALAAAIAKVRATGADVRVDWAGRVDDDGEAGRAFAAVDRFALEHVWRWLGQRNDVAALLQGCDALVLPSLWEGLPNVVCEALASGVPVLASAVSDNPQLVPDGENGFNFSAESIEAIAEGILRFTALNPGEREAMGRRARAFAERELGLSAYVDKYERLLKS